MKKLGIALAVGVLLVTCVPAQETTSSGKSKSKDRTITGCLSQGDGPNTFVLNADDGSTWDVKSDAVSLVDHVGHTITAKGIVSNITAHNAKEETKDAAASAGMKKSNNEHGDLKIESIKMVSKSCK